MVETIVGNSHAPKTAHHVDQVINRPSSEAPHNAHESATSVFNTTSQQPLNNCASKIQSSLNLAV